jgi:hypothetical protein
MDVAFTIRRADALRALKEIKVNRGREGKDDLLHVLVSEYAVTFRAVGTESEYPVNGTGPGAAQLPIAIFERAVEMRTTNELQLRLTDGAIFSGKSAVRSSRSHGRSNPRHTYQCAHQFPSLRPARYSFLRTPRWILDKEYLARYVKQFLRQDAVAL